MSSKVYKHIRKLQKRRNELEDRLDRSLSLQEFLPGAFDSGSVTTQITGISTDGFTWTLIKGNGEQIERNVKDVPYIQLQSHPKFLEDCQSGRYGPQWQTWAQNLK